MNQSEQINELAAALAKAQGEITAAKADVSNTFFKAKYADLASVWHACRASLSKHGLSVTQGCVFIEGKYTLETVLRHQSGQWCSYLMPLMMAKNDMQALGSAITYARRYSLAAIIGIAQSDDDGNLAAGKNTISNQRQPVQQRPRAQARNRAADSAKSNLPRQATTPRPQGGVSHPPRKMQASGPNTTQ